MRSFNLNLLYFNCRELLNKDRLYLLEKEVDKIKWDIIVLTEVRRLGGRDEKKNGNYFYYFGCTKGYRGGGEFLLKKTL